jgi:hypothetical protein
MIYRTTESIEAVLFKTFNYPYIGCKKIERPNGKTAIEFEFDVPRLETVKEMFKDYYNHVLMVDAYEHDEAVKFIRKEIYGYK